MTFVDDIQSCLITKVQLKEKRPNIYQVLAPFYHEDGDMLEVYIEKSNTSNRLKICDFGHTLMRLSYNIELSGNNEKVYHQILKENLLDEKDGNIFIETSLENLNSTFLHYAHSIGKISSLHYFDHKRKQSMFYETLFEFVETSLQSFCPCRDYVPLTSHPENKVDIMFETNRLPLFLFGVQGDIKAADVINSCLEFKLEHIEYKSIVVYENFDALSKKTQNRILRTTDKQFLGLEHFKADGADYLKKEAA